MREALDERLSELRMRLAEMAAQAQSMLEEATRYIETAESHLAKSVRDRETEVNRLQTVVDDLAVRITAEHQPVAHDVRMVFVATRASTDIERIADQAVNIIDHAVRAHSQPPVQIPAEFVRISSLVRRQVSDAVAALIGRDVPLACGVLETDDEVDSLRVQLFRMLLRSVITDPLAAQKHVSMILISQNFERAGDHATNIAEEAIYLVQGKDVRHQYDRSSRPRFRSMGTF